MFESEEQIEKQRSFTSPLLLVFLLIVIIGVAAAYFLLKSQKDLTPQEAAAVVGSALNLRGPASVHFHGGVVMPSVDEKPRDPHYKLLEKAGLISLAPATGGGVRVAVTALGDRTFSELPEFKKFKNPDGTESFVVPLAERKLVEVAKVTMVGPNEAKVEYTWKWQPNKLGEQFDASGPLVKNFNTWDRATLIQKYGADFYKGDPAKAVLTMVRTDKGWKIAAE
jgi:hypothetical protein